jgi:hypothetical protein
MVTPTAQAAAVMAAYEYIMRAAAVVHRKDGVTLAAVPSFES